MDETTYVPSGIECDCGVQMEYDGDKLICFFCSHSEYPDDELIEILAAQPLRAADAMEPLCQVCYMPLAQHVYECVTPSRR